MTSFRFTIQDFLLVAAAAIAIASVPKVLASKTHLRSPSGHLLTGSKAPTDCYTITPPKVLSSICMAGGEEIETIEWPAGRCYSMNIHGQSDTYVDFTITSEQWMLESGLAVYYDSIHLESKCDVFGHASLGDSFGFQAQCHYGVTEATILVNMDAENGDPDEDWKACDPEHLRDTGARFCAYRVEIPCKKSRVDCEELKKITDDSHNDVGVLPFRIKSTS